MNTTAAFTAGSEEAYQETLSDRMAQAKLSLADALRFATQIATTLRDLHAQGLIYGAVSSQLILLNQDGAALRNTGNVARLGDRQSDVKAFGRVLGEMFSRVICEWEFEPVRQQAHALALNCEDGVPEMRQVMVTLRLLGLQARQARPTAPPPAPVQQLKVEPKRPKVQKVRVRLRFNLQWQPLVSLATFALAGK